VDTVRRLVEKTTDSWFAIWIDPPTTFSTVSGAPKVSYTEAEKKSYAEKKRAERTSHQPPATTTATELAIPSQVPVAAVWRPSTMVPTVPLRPIEVTVQQVKLPYQGKNPCSWCGLVGHGIQDCKGNSKGQQPTREDIAKFFEAMKAKKMSMFWKSIMFDSKSKPHPQEKILGTLNGEVVTILIDTGGEIGIIGIDLCNAIGTQIKKTEFGEVLLMDIKTSTRILGYVIATLSSGNFKGPVKLHVTDAELGQQVILGQDLLEHAAFSQKRFTEEILRRYSPPEELLEEAATKPMRMKDRSTSLPVSPKRIGEEIQIASLEIDKPEWIGNVERVTGVEDNVKAGYIQAVTHSFLYLVESHDPNSPIRTEPIGVEIKDGEKPARSGVRSFSQLEQEFIQKWVDELLEKGWIEQSDSMWISPIQIVKNDGKEWRIVLDLRDFNECVEYKSISLLKLDELPNKIR
jgi:hypothetical protein